MCRRRMVCACTLMALGCGLLIGQLAKTWIAVTLIGFALVGLGICMLGTR